MTMPSNENKSQADTRTSRRRKSRWSDALPRLLPASGETDNGIFGSLVEISKRLFAPPARRRCRRRTRWANRIAAHEPLEQRQLLAQVGFNYVATVLNTTGAPFGIPGGTINGKTVTGGFRYETTTTDTNAGNTAIGNYPHNFGGGAFTVTLPGGTIVTGSGRPFATVQNNTFGSDNFTYDDGQSGVNPIKAPMLVNGVSDPTVSLTFSITDGAQTAVASDALPDPYGFGTQPHNFVIGDVNGTVSLRLTIVTAASGPVDTVNVIEVAQETAEIDFDPNTNLIWGTVPSRNAIVSIDVNTGAIGPEIFVGSNPNAIDISDDGTTAWVGLDGAFSVRKVDLVNGVAQEQFSLGNDRALDIEIFPGQNDTLAVSYTDNIFFNRPTIILDSVGGVVSGRPSLGTGQNAEFNETGSELYTNDTTGVFQFRIRRYAVGANGLTLLNQFDNLVGAAGEMRYADGNLYFTDGSIVKVGNPFSKVATYNVPDTPQIPNVDDSKSYHLAGPTIRIFSQTTFLELNAVTIPGVLGNTTDPERFGSNGLAFRTSGNQVMLVRTDPIGQILQAPNQDNVIRVIRNGSDVDVRITNASGTTTTSFDFASTQEIRIQGGTANDTLIVDYTGDDGFGNPDPIPGTGIDFRGGGGTDNILRVEGTGVEIVNYTPDVGTTGSGVVEVLGASGGLVKFSGLTPVEMDTVNSVTLITAGNADNLTVDNPAAGQIVVTGTSSSVPIEELRMMTIGTFIIDAATNNVGGNDVITFNAATNGLGPDLADIGVFTGDGDDLLSVALPWTLPGGGDFVYVAGGGLGDFDQLTVTTPDGENNTINVVDGEVQTSGHQTIKYDNADLGFGDRINVRTGNGNDSTIVTLPGLQILPRVALQNLGGTDNLQVIGVDGADDRFDVRPSSIGSGSITESASADQQTTFVNVNGDVVVTGQAADDDRITVTGRNNVNDMTTIGPDAVTGNSHLGRVVIDPTLVAVNFDDMQLLTVNTGDETGGGDDIVISKMDIPVNINGGQPGSEALPGGDHLSVDRTGVTTLDVTFTAPGSGNGTLVINGDMAKIITFTSIEGNPTCSSVVLNTDDDGLGSLREAIECTNGFPGKETIRFEIPGPGPHTITPLSPLPAITDAVVVDGTTQPGFFGTPVIVLDGSVAGPGAAGLRLSSPEASTVRGLVVNHWSDAGIQLASGDGHSVVGNYIGTDVTGITAAPNNTGVRVQSANSAVGTAAEGNLISGNTLSGVRISGVDAKGNNVWNNKIGTNAAGTAALPNNIGVEIVAGQNNLVGGTSANQRNVISGNTLYGVWLRGDNNSVQGNFVGTNMTGDAAVPNREGVIVTVSTGNVVGGTAVGAGNLISGNSDSGVWLSAARANGNFVQGNVIGLNAAGDAALGNRDGVEIAGAPNNTIGGTQISAGNVISGNSRNGVLIDGDDATTNMLQRNLIGTNADGDTAIGNRRGILIDGAPTNQIGAPGVGNLISGNQHDGVRLQGTDTKGNVLQDNRVGTDFDGTTALPNKIGIQIGSGASGNVIGGDSTLDEGNLISGNVRRGVTLKDADGNMIFGNLIGTNFDGTAPLGHKQDGVRINPGSNNHVGGSGQGQGNVIAASGDFGIRLGADNNTVQGNYIGTNITGTRVLANDVGVLIRGSGNLIGGDSTAGEGNLISGNVEEGVLITRAAATGNMLRGNLIGTNISGANPMPNKYGVRLTLGASGNFIGGDSTAGQGNTISGNTLQGVYLKDTGTSGNHVEGNNIGINQFAFAALPNGKQGVLIDEGDSNTIGGSAAGMGNLIAGNTLDGVKISGPSATDNMVQGNVIGRLDIPNRHGVLISDFAAENMIGGVGAGESNTIAHNTQRGVWINAKGGFGNGVRRNTIHDNGGATDLGLDLSIAGQNKNDANDADKGPNKTQNYPVISSAIRRGANLEITFLVDALPGAGDNQSNYGVNGLEIEFYVADSDGQEGEVFVGQAFYPKASAKKSFTVTIPAGAAVIGANIVATATDFDANTSEFSDPKTVTANLLAAGGPVSGNAATLSAAELAPVLDLAVSRLESFGFAANLFSTVDVTIADLPGAELGLAAANSITIDANAAGYGWFVSPESRDQRLEPDDSGAYSSSGPWTLDSGRQMDLLTAVMHELGHVAGLDDLYDPAAENDVMFAFLRSGVRKTLTDASLGGAEVDLVFNDYE